MTAIDYTPQGVCSRNIHVELADDGNTINAVSFVGGCNGNLKAISKLVAGKPVDEIVSILEGNTCGKPEERSSQHEKPLFSCPAAAKRAGQVRGRERGDEQKA